MTKRAQFSRRNQPVKCRICGKLTTWSDVNGNRGLDLCKDCFDRATLDNEHYDGHHEGAPNGSCRLCNSEVAKARN